MAYSNFTGVEYPNIEDKKTLTRGIELDKEQCVDLVMATDPDCDRELLAENMQ